MPVHELHDAFRDRHPKAGASVSVGGGRVLLAESVKQVREEFAAHADPRITDGELQRSLMFVPASLFNEERHASACRCEFDGVAENVDHNLPELHAIAKIVVIYFTDRPAIIVQAFVSALPADDGVDLFEIFSKREFFVFDDHSAGLNAGHIQNVIDNTEKMLC